MATIETVATSKGDKRYKVRWWEGPGRQRKRTFSRFEEARRFKTQVERQLDTGDYIDPSRGAITLCDWLESFLGTQHLEPSTVALYRTLARLYLWVPEEDSAARRLGTPGVPSLAARPLNRIRKADVQDLLGAMKEVGVGARTIAATHSLIRRLFSSAVDREVVARNPALGIKVSKGTPREHRYLTAEEVGQVAAVVHERDRALVLLLAYGGLRIGEACFLRVKHVDLFRQRVDILGAAKEVRGHRIESSTKTDRVRSLHLPPFLREELIRHRASFTDPDDPEAYFFRSPDGGPVRANNWRKRAFRPACARAGVEPIPTGHDLRHTAASLAISAGAHPKEIQEMLGHASITMTLDLYAHLLPQLHERTGARLDQIYRASLRVENVDAGL